MSLAIGSSIASGVVLLSFSKRRRTASSIDFQGLIMLSLSDVLGGHAVKRDGEDELIGVLLTGAHEKHMLLGNVNCLLL